MKVSLVQTLSLLLISLCLSACNAPKEPPHVELPKVTVSQVESKAVTLTEQFVCQIHSHHNIKIRTPEAGYLAPIEIHEGQTVKQDDLLFQVKLLNGKGKQDAENEGIVVPIKAPFDGMVDRLPRQEGSFVERGEILTTLSDNSLMWVYFRVPEARYLEFKSAELDQHPDDLKIELRLANGQKFDQTGKLGAIGADFDMGTGNIAFRADFPNPSGLLRHGQTGTVLINRVQKDAIVVPQRATFEVLLSRYVYVVDKDHVAHQREIVVENAVENESGDLFIVKTGLGVDDKIIVDGIRAVRDGEKVDCADCPSEKVVAN